MAVRTLLVALLWAVAGTEPSPDQLVAAAAGAWARHDVPALKALATRAVAASPGSAMAWSLLGAAETELGNLEEAQTALERATELDPAIPQFHLGLASVYERREQWGPAAESLGRVVGLAPGNAEAQRRLGRALLKLDREAEAIAPWSAYVALKPDDPEGRSDLGMAYLRAGRRTEATEQLRQALARTKDDSERLRIAALLADEGLDPSGAKDAARSVLRATAASCRSMTLDRPPEDYPLLLERLRRSYRTLAIAAMAEGADDRSELVSAWYQIVPDRATAGQISEQLARWGQFEEAFRYYGLTLDRSRLLQVSAKTVPEGLTAWASQRYPTDSAFRSALKAHVEEREEVRRLRPKSGEFEMPDRRAGASGEVSARVLVDESGSIMDVQFLSGVDPYLSAARADMTRLQFEPIGPSEGGFKSIRTFEIFYLPANVRAFWEFDVPPLGTTDR